MNTNFQITIQTFKQLHEPLQQLPQTCHFTKLFKSKDNKVIKRKVFQTKKEWLTWKNSINQELLNQRILSAKYPSKVLTILNYTVETTNHQRNLYITYDCGDEMEPLFQYLNNNSVSFSEQAQIFEQLLQLTCILFRSQFEHTNLKPNNILYNKKQVLITDFGSARTHYQNFLKEYTAQAEKEWQNNLLFFYPQEYQKIMEEDNSDFRNDQWKELDISNQNFRKSIDIWALSMMMIQVFENNQILPKQLTDYYGLNNKLLLQKIDNLKQYSAGIFSEAIYSLIIQKKEPEQVYQKFIKQKQMVKIEPFNMESTFTIKQIFDPIIDDDSPYQPYKPENYFLDKKDIEKIEGQFDDASSVVSSNYQIDIVGFPVVKQKNNLTQIINLVPPLESSPPKREKPKTQKFEISQYHNQLFEFQDNRTDDVNVNNKRKTITISNYDFIQQQNIGNHFEDPSNKDIHEPFYPIQTEMQFKQENPNQDPLTVIKDDKDDNKLKQFVPQQIQNNVNQQSGFLQVIKLEEIDDDGKPQNGSGNESPNFNQNSTFQFLEAQNLNTVNENSKYQGGKIPIGPFESFQFHNTKNQNLLNIEDQQDSKKVETFKGQQQIQGQNQQINLMAIDDFEVEDPYIPKIPDVGEKDLLINTEQQGVNLENIDDPNQKPTLPIVKPQKESMFLKNEDNNQISQGVQVFDGEDTGPKKPKLILKEIVYNPINNKDQQNLTQVEEIDDQIPDKDKSKIQNIFHIDNNNEPYQPIKSINDSDEKPDNKIVNNPYSLSVIKNILNEGVTQLEDKDQKEILEQLKVIQKILTKLSQHITDPTEIFDVDNDEYKKNQNQIQQVINEIEQQKDKELLELIQDVNDGVKTIIQKQKVFQIIDDNQIQNNLILLNLLNQDQLSQVKKKVQNNKLVTDQIDKLIDVKDDLKKFKQLPTMQNLLQKHQIDLLNKEELKIYQRLLISIPKDKRQGDKIINQQLIVDRKLQEIQKIEKEQQVIEKFIAFLQNPSESELLLNDDLKQLNDDQKQKYKAALEDLLLKVQQRLKKKTIQDQINTIDKDLKKKPQASKIEKPIKDVSKNKNLNFQDAYMHVMKNIGDEIDGEILSLNQYIREFQLTSTAYQITDLLPNDCQNYQQQNTKRIAKFYDYQGQKYKGETLNDQPDGIGILRKAGVSSIYKGLFKQGKFYWGQVLEMNDQGQLTQYIGYYDQQYQVKIGKAKLKWYQPSKVGFCGGYIFNDYEFYEGDFVLGYIHGKGKKIYEDQSEYEGNWKKNKRTGQGRYTLKKQGRKTITYDGEFQNDVQHGKEIKAIHHHQTGLDLVVQGEYRHGKPIGSHKLIFNEVEQRQIDY